MTHYLVLIIALASLGCSRQVNTVSHVGHIEENYYRSPLDEKYDFIEDKGDDITPGATDAILNKKLIIGMTGDEAEASWGKPTRINRYNYGGKNSEQWIYEGGEREYYIHFENGRLSGWSDYQN